MSVGTILVCLNTAERAGELIKAGCMVAEQQDAHLIGLYVVPGVQYYSAPAGTHAAVDINKEQRAYYEGHLDGIKKQFEETTRKYAVRAEWRSLQSDTHQVAGVAIEHGMQSDLIIAGQSPEDGFDSFEPEFAERVIMESGRPVLIIPHTGNFNSVGTNALVAWNGTTESARAAGEALPLLQAAEKTTVVWINPESVAGEDALAGAELATMLARHNITSVAEQISTGEKNTGEVLLTKAADLGAD